MLNAVKMSSLSQQKDSVHTVLTGARRRAGCGRLNSGHLALFLSLWHAYLVCVGRQSTLTDIRARRLGGSCVVAGARGPATGRPC